MSKAVNGHITRYSDSSFCDEVCILCGYTDASDALDHPCQIGHGYAPTHDYDFKRSEKGGYDIWCKTCGGNNRDNFHHTCEEVIAGKTPDLGRSENRTEPSVRHTPRQGWQDKMAFDLSDSTPIAFSVVKTPYGMINGPAKAIEYVAEIIRNDNLRKEVGPHLSISNAGFVPDLKALINAYSMENGSDTHDFVLAQYLMDCLSAFDSAVNKRTALNNGWNPGPGSAAPTCPPVGYSSDFTPDVETHH